MDEQSFTMTPQRMGRMRYLLLTMLVPLAIMQSFLWMSDSGLIPKIKVLAFIVVYGSLALMAVMGWLLIFKKNHTLTFHPTSVEEISWRRIQTTHSIRQIRYYRRNLLGEYILTDSDGKTVFCVEPNMTNRDRFLDWLAAHHIESK